MSTASPRGRRPAAKRRGDRPASGPRAGLPSKLARMTPSADDRQPPRMTRMVSFAVLLGLVVLGGAIELLQAIPSVHRDAEWLDWLADCAAVLVTFAAYQAAVSAWRYRRR